MKPYRISGCGSRILDSKFKIQNSKTAGLSVADTVNSATLQLSEAGIANARLDAEALLSHVLRKNRAWIITHGENSLDDASSAIFRDAIGRRTKREPLQYIIGNQEFWGLEFMVTPDVLIPRPETEFIIEAALATIEDRIGPARIIDLCTGSGCIAVSLAKELSGAHVLAIDTSARALLVAKKNAANHGVSDRIRFFEGDLFEPLKQFDMPGQMDLIVSNPPYVRADELDTLQPEVRDFEPEMALIAGPEGTELAKRIIQLAPKYLKKNGALIMEMGLGQAAALRNIAGKTGAYTAPEIIKDLAGIERIMVARKA